MQNPSLLCNHYENHREVRNSLLTEMGSSYQFAVLQWTLDVYDIGYLEYVLLIL